MIEVNAVYVVIHKPLSITAVYVNEVILGRPLDSFIMGPSCQRNHVIRGLYLSATNLQVRERGWTLSSITNGPRLIIPGNRASVKPPRGQDSESVQVGKRY